MAKSYCGKYEDFKNYIDPDDLYRYDDKISVEYYRNLVKFLNAQEEKIIKDDEQWEYSLVEKGESQRYGTPNVPVAIMATVKESNRFALFLRSDQFGFSAPRTDKNIACDEKYPYWRYYGGYDNRKEKIEKWVKRTRTIGGSFIWPLSKDIDNKWVSKYNYSRGIKSYIEDSVDLTLYEIRNYYKYNEYLKDILAESEIVIKDCAMIKWLNHFGNFETYVKFFMFDDDFEEDEVADGILDDENFGENRKIDELKKYVFCQKNETEGKEHKYYPIDILIGNQLKENKVEDYKKTRRIKNCSVKELEIVLDRLSKMTLLRTARMLEVINNFESSQS